MADYAGKNYRTVQYLKTVHFDHPEFTTCYVNFLPATWIKRRETLEELVMAHPRIFGRWKKGQHDFDRVWGPHYEPGTRTDSWGVTWQNVQRGMDSLDIGHPLEDWAAFDTWRAPSVEQDLWGPRKPWEQIRKEVADARNKGEISWGWGLAHGFMYMMLYYLRGFENFMIDIATDEPRLAKLIKIVESYNAAVISGYIAAGIEAFGTGEDLGNQHGLPISPASWRKYIKPSYERMFGQCRDRGIIVYLHSDGHILEIVPDLIDVGISVLNPQFRANGLAGLKEATGGKVCINLDLDRQMFPFATPSELEDHVATCFETLYRPEGGLMLMAEIGPDVPLENVEAICRTLEKVCRPPEPPKE